MFGCRNLLRPAGVMLRPATFKLKVFRAEDIPRSKFLHKVSPEEVLVSST